MAFNWQSLFDAGLQTARGVAEMQFAKKAQRKAESLARKAERAARGAYSLPTLGLGYSAVPYTSAGQGFPGGVSFGSIPRDFQSSPVGQMLGMEATHMPGVTGGGSSTALSPFSGCFRSAASSTNLRISPCKELTATGPDGKSYTWIYRGRPILYSGDVRLVRSVQKVLRKQGRRAGSFR